MVCKATPELEMLVDIAEFFETSVDAMLNYGWQKLSMGQAVEKLSQFATDKRLTEGMEFAEKVLQRYPNSFERVFSATRDFDSSQLLETVQEELVTQMINEIVEAIFNAAVANW